MLSLLRILKFSLQDIFRNFWLSLVTVLILVLALFSINLLLAVKAISFAAVDTVKEKIDISLYLQNNSNETSIMELKAQLASLENVREVVYVSQAQALEQFKAKHRYDPEIMGALQELDKNPLTPSLVIRPKDMMKYDDLINALNKIDNPIIETRNFDDYKLILSKINAITNKVSEAGFLISIIFIVITLLVVYNTVRVSIYTHREEIGIMKLVGASSWFIKAPFLISGIIYAFISMIICGILFYLFLTLLQPYLAAFFMGYNFDIIQYFVNNGLQIFGLELLGAALVNVVASLIAVGKYSNV